MSPREPEFDPFGIQPMAPRSTRRLTARWPSARGRPRPVRRRRAGAGPADRGDPRLLAGPRPARPSAAVVRGRPGRRAAGRRGWVRGQRVHPVRLHGPDSGVRGDPPAGRLRRRRGGDPTTYQRRQTALIKSRHVLQAAINRPGIAELPSVRNNPDPVGWLETNLKADFSVSPEILRITLSGPNPTELIALLDAVREAYLAEGVNKDQTDKKAALDRLQRLIERGPSQAGSGPAGGDDEGRGVRVPGRSRRTSPAAGRAEPSDNLRTQFVPARCPGQDAGGTAGRPEGPPAGQGRGRRPARPAELAAATELALARTMKPRRSGPRSPGSSRRSSSSAGRPRRAPPMPTLTRKSESWTQAKERLTAREKAVRDDTRARSWPAESVRGFDFRLREHASADGRPDDPDRPGQGPAGGLGRLRSRSWTATPGSGPRDRRTGPAGGPGGPRSRTGSRRPRGGPRQWRFELRAPPRAQTHEDGRHHPGAEPVEEAQDGGRGGRGRVPGRAPRGCLPGPADRPDRLPGRGGPAPAYRGGRVHPADQLVRRWRHSPSRRTARLGRQRPRPVTPPTPAGPCC